MRASLTAILSLILLAACSPAPVKPAPAQAQAAPPPAAAAPAPVAQSAPPPPPVPSYPTVPVPVVRVPADKDHPLVRILTNQGELLVQLDATRAPLTVAEFLKHAKAHKFDNTSFYRIVPGFVIQAGDYTADYKVLPDEKPIPNESGNGLSNLRGSLGLARDADPHSGSYVFYINLVDNRKLDPRPDRWGYAVFGQVVEGLDVMDKIAAVPTHDLPKSATHDDFSDAPVAPVTILKMTVLPPEKP